MDRSLLDVMGEKEYSSDPSVREAEVKKDLSSACLTPDRRPSVETSLHNCMDFKYVVHLHPTLVNGLMCSVNVAGECKRLFPEALYVEYTDPGYTLFKKVYDRIKAYRKATGKEPQVIFLQNHGVFVGADTTEEIDRIYDGITARLEESASHVPEGESEIPESVTLTIPVIRQMLSRSGRGLKTLRVTRNALVDRFLDAPEAVMRPFTPDIVVYCKSEYLYICSEDIIEEAQEKIEDYVARRGYTPKVLLIKGIGLVAVGKDAREADVVTEVFLDAMKVAFLAGSFGGPHPMEKAWSDFIDNWEVENYRRKVASGLSSGRMGGKTVIVTGAAQGFGEGIARNLMLQGANIVVADLNEQAGKATADSFNGIAIRNKAIFVKTNVADSGSLENLMKETVINFGALDVFVSNAGVLRAGGLEAMTLENFEFVTKINYNAYFLCAKAASRIMKAETAADPSYFADIIQINSKSGLRGSKANFAYAGSKFGGLGLTQSFALELAPFRVKVNSICPGNYYDGPLWSNPENGLFVQYLAAGKVPGAKTVEDVKEYYLAQVPMRKGCTPEDVTKAVLYAVEQTGETGQAIPVTGGQVMLG
jgi:NAD(P)-dependent dehydrogenase (short-subunit alcohol dehydrogenase family)/rhamnose utilization protein RhaD (predicted bifunctional aldolase and dehydrogenase)